MLSKACFSSATDEWETPKYLFQALKEEFGLELDVCATPANAKCPDYFTKEEDGLMQDWRGRHCWMNPPYGRAIVPWIRKAYNEAKKGAIVVCLLPARTDTAWWQDLVSCARQVRFIRGRVKFGGGETSAPFPSAIVVFEDPDSRPFFHRVSYVKYQPNQDPHHHTEEVFPC